MFVSQIVRHHCLRNLLSENMFAYADLQTAGRTEPIMFLYIFLCALPFPQGHIAAHKATGFKIIVFFTTARICQAMAEVAMKAGIPEVLEIHSRKNQGYRTKVSYRDILFTRAIYMQRISLDMSVLIYIYATSVLYRLVGSQSVV